MNWHNLRWIILSAAISVLFGITAKAANIEFVPVGNPGNEPDPRYTGISIGSVAYTYQIGKYEITAGQYCEFLNAVAKTDTYGLYENRMNGVSDYLGYTIHQSGQPGNYIYSVETDWANRPVNLVSWGDAARFCNWLENGQPVGPQGVSTTEDGSYLLDGATTNATLSLVTRKDSAHYVIPTENEWYKAAFYDPHKTGATRYWDYPTKSNDIPSNVFSKTGANNANFSNNGFTIDSPYWRTEVGALAGSSSAYGTFDQGGNVWEWDEAVLSPGYSFSYRGFRGGSFGLGSEYLAASDVGYEPPAYEDNTIGFRIAYVPEPSGIVLLFIGMSGMLIWRMRKRY